MATELDKMIWIMHHLGVPPSQLLGLTEQELDAMFRELPEGRSRA